MKKMLKIFLIAVCAGSLFPVTDGFAFLPKIDLLKTPSKLSTYFSDLKNNAEKATEWVSNSKAGQLVGDGIKETKKGIAYANQTYADAMKLYGRVVETADKVKSSDEYKTAVISKQIAEASSELKRLQEEKLYKQEELQQEMELIQEQNNAKISNINGNLDVLGATAADGSALDGVNAQLQQLQQETQEQLQDLEQRYEQIESEYEDKIKEQKTKVSELTKQLSEVANVKLVSENAAESVKNTQENMFTLLGEETNLNTRREKRKNRNKAFSDAVDETGYKAASGLLTISSAQEELDAKKNTAETMPGESETSGVAAEVVLKQAEMMEQYLEYVIADLKLQTTQELVSMAESFDDVKNISTNFNFCDYALKKQDNGRSLLEQAKGAYQSASQNLSSAKEKVADTKQKLDEATALAKEAGEVVNDAKNAAAGMAEKETSALTGMF